MSGLWAVHKGCVRPAHGALDVQVAIAGGPHLTKRGGTPRIVDGVPANVTNRALRIMRMQASLRVGCTSRRTRSTRGRRLAERSPGGARYGVALQGSEH